MQSVSSSARPFAGSLLVSGLALLLTLVGCGAGPNLPEGDLVADDGGSPIIGMLRGGQQPISGATVSLYIAGLTGYGSAQGSGNAIATSTTDGSGNFTLPTFTCPSGSNQLAYLVAKSGNAGGGTNAAIHLLAVLEGPASAGALTTNNLCSTIKTNAGGITVNIDEVSTVVAINALAQFFNPSTETIGSAATNPQGMINSFNVAGSIMNVSRGTVNETYTPGGLTINGTSTNITATPEANKINLIADILAACVNSSGANSLSCTTLFADAAPPPASATTTLGASFVYPAATDTLQAAYYMAVNPINATTAGAANENNISGLFGLAQSTPPFPTTIAQQPTDWGIGLTYSGYSATNSTLSSPTSLSVDASGDVYFLNTNATYPTGADLGELNPYGGLNAAGITSYAPITGLTLDTNSYGYIGRTSNKVTASFKPGGTISDLAQIEDASLSSATFLASQFAADGTNVFVTSNGTTNPGSIFQVPFQAQASSPFTSATATALSTYPVNNGHAIPSLTNASPLVVDVASNLWTVAGNALYKVPYNAYPSAGASGTAGSTPVSVSGTFQAPTALAVDHSNNVWIANAAGGTPANGYLSYYNASTTTVTSDSVNGDGGVNSPAGLAVDGAGNVWVTSAGQGSSFTGQTVSEFALLSGSLAALSPPVGFSHAYNKPGSIAVDPSGNVWVANVGAYATASQPGTITVLLGAASPVVTPLSLGVKNNKLGSLP